MATLPASETLDAAPVEAAAIPAQATAQVNAVQQVPPTQTPVAAPASTPDQQATAAPVATSPQEPAPQAIPADSAAAGQPAPNNSVTSTLTFENFVIGDSNRMAYSMAVSVAETPGKPHLNPLFI